MSTNACSFANLWLANLNRNCVIVSFRDWRKMFVTHASSEYGYNAAMPCSFTCVKEADLLKHKFINSFELNWIHLTLLLFRHFSKVCHGSRTLTTQPYWNITNCLVTTCDATFAVHNFRIFYLNSSIIENTKLRIIFITVQKLCHYSYAEKWSIFTVLNI